MYIFTSLHYTSHQLRWCVFVCVYILLNSPFPITIVNYGYGKHNYVILISYMISRLCSVLFMNKISKSPIT